METALGNTLEDLGFIFLLFLYIYMLYQHFQHAENRLGDAAPDAAIDNAPVSTCIQFTSILLHVRHAVKYVEDPM